MGKEKGKGKGKVSSVKGGGGLDNKDLNLTYHSSTASRNPSDPTSHAELS
jgi:hypothetical protein